MQVGGTGRAVTLLGDDDFRLALHPFQLVPPDLMFRRAFFRFGLRQVIFVAVNEHDHVRVLLDGAGFAKVGELGPLVVTRFHLAGKL